MEKIRSFIAIDISYNEKINSLIKELKNSGALIKLVEPENIHVTIKFLGDISHKTITEIENILKNSIIGIKPFQFNLEGVGVFPNEKYIKIIWIGIKNSEILEKISKRINKKVNLILSNSKFQKFLPHITICRVKSAKNKEKLLEIVDKYKNYKFANIIVDSIKLKKSELTSKGPIYSDIIKLKL
jgi:2'-5' RNA ligase